MPHAAFYEALVRTLDNPPADIEDDVRLVVFLLLLVQEWPSSPAPAPVAAVFGEFLLRLQVRPNHVAEDLSKVLTYLRAHPPADRAWQRVQQISQALGGGAFGSHAQQRAAALLGMASSTAPPAPTDGSAPRVRAGPLGRQQLMDALKKKGEGEG